MYSGAHVEGLHGRLELYVLVLVMKILDAQSEDAVRILQTLGLKTEGCVSFALIIDADEGVKVEVVYQVPESLPEFINVLKAYRLVEIGS